MLDYTQCKRSVRGCGGRRQETRCVFVACWLLFVVNLLLRNEINPVRSFRPSTLTFNLLLFPVLNISVSIATEPPPGLNPQYWMDSDASTFRVRGMQNIVHYLVLWVVFYSCFVQSTVSCNSRRCSIPHFTVTFYTIYRTALIFLLPIFLLYFLQARTT